MLMQKRITYLKGVGEKRAVLFEKLGILTAQDLLEHYPRGYMDFTKPEKIAACTPEENHVLRVTVIRKLQPAPIRRGLTVYKAVAADDSGEITIVFYNVSFQFDKLKENEEILLYGRVTGNLLRKEISSPTLLSLQETERILPLYPLTEGLTQQHIRTAVKSALQLLNEEIYEPVPKEILSRGGFCSLPYAMQNIHFPQDEKALQDARSRLVFDELLVLSLGLLILKGRSTERTGCRMKDFPMEEFSASLPFELTGAQCRAIDDCLRDMRRSVPMNRLIQGDVGSGKTAVAAACAYFAHKNGYQTAIMAPTEILAAQHYHTLRKMLSPLGAEVTLLSGSMKAKEKSTVRTAIANGEFAVVAGTHAIIQKDTAFANLGLVITDEQHRFGVEQRAELAAKGENPHRLVMSATPIPRTMALMIYGDLDLSVIDEMPAGRLKIETYAVSGKLRQRAYGFIRDRLREGRQGYIVCAMIDENDSDIKSAVAYERKLAAEDFRDFRVGLLHGRMNAAEKERVMTDFSAHRIDLLVCTTVVEVGVDVPNAAVILIENADRFGLSQLHQLRGRVGRGKDQSYCILVTDVRDEVSITRLKVLSRTTDGFAISEQDLKLRGPGDFFGSRQHGLPKLKIADMAEDFAVVGKAQAAARDIHDADAMLAKPEHKELLALTQKLFGQNIVMN